MNTKPNEESRPHEGKRKLTEAERALAIRRGGADEELDKSIELAAEAKAADLRGDASKALSLLEEAEKLRRNVPAKEWLANLLLPKAGISIQLGKHEQALTALREAEDLYKQLGDLKGVANSLSFQIQILTKLGRLQEAIFLIGKKVAAESGRMPIDHDPLAGEP